EQAGGEAKAEQKHTLRVRVLRAAEDAAPVEARARVQQLGHVADPREPLPEVLRAVDAERQQQVLRRKTPDLAAAEGHRPGALTHVFTTGSSANFSDAKPQCSSTMNLPA